MQLHQRRMQLPALMDTQGQRCGKPQAVLCAPQNAAGARGPGSSSSSPSLFCGRWVWENSLDPSTAWAGTAQLLLGLSKPRAQGPSFSPSREELELKTLPKTQLTFSTKFVFTLKCSSSIKTFHILSRTETTAEFLAHTHRLQLKLYSKLYKQLPFKNCFFYNINHEAERSFLELMEAI